MSLLQALEKYHKSLTICPITNKEIRFAVTTRDGETYDSEPLESYLIKHNNLTPKKVWVPMNGWSVRLAQNTMLNEAIKKFNASNKSLEDYITFFKSTALKQNSTELKTAPVITHLYERGAVNHCFPYLGLQRALVELKQDMAQLSDDERSVFNQHNLFEKISQYEPALFKPEINVKQDAWKFWGNIGYVSFDTAYWIDDIGYDLERETGSRFFLGTISFALLGFTYPLSAALRYLAPEKCCPEKDPTKLRAQSKLELTVYASLILPLIAVVVYLAISAPANVFLSIGAIGGLFAAQMVAPMLAFLTTSLLAATLSKKNIPSSPKMNLVYFKPEGTVELEQQSEQKFFIDTSSAPPSPGLPLSQNLGGILMSHVSLNENVPETISKTPPVTVLWPKQTQNFDFDLDKNKTKKTIPLLSMK